MRQSKLLLSSQTPATIVLLLFCVERSSIIDPKLGYSTVSRADYPAAREGGKIASPIEGDGLICYCLLPSVLPLQQSEFS